MLGSRRGDVEHFLLGALQAKSEGLYVEALKSFSQHIRNGVFQTGYLGGTGYAQEKGRKRAFSCNAVFLWIGASIVVGM